MENCSKEYQELQKRWDALWRRSDEVKAQLKQSCANLQSATHYLEERSEKRRIWLEEKNEI